MPASARAKEPPIERLPLEERIHRRAYELYVLRGNQSGSELDDWLQAEEEIPERATISGRTTTRGLPRSPGSSSCAPPAARSEVAVVLEELPSDIRRMMEAHFLEGDSALKGPAAEFQPATVRASLPKVRRHRGTRP